MFARSLLLLNTVALDDSFDLGGDMEAFVRRREVQALVALGRAEAVEIGS